MPWSLRTLRLRQQLRLSLFASPSVTALSLLVTISVELQPSLRTAPHPRVSFANDFSKRLEPQTGMKVVYARTSIDSDRDEVKKRGRVSSVEKGQQRTDVGG
jgi:hypothetical protein